MQWRQGSSLEYRSIELQQYYSQKTETSLAEPLPLDTYVLVYLRRMEGGHDELVTVHLPAYIVSVYRRVRDGLKTENR